MRLTQAGASLLVLGVVAGAIKASAASFYGMYDVHEQAETTTTSYRTIFERASPLLRADVKRGADEPPQVVDVRVYGGVLPEDASAQPRATPAVLDGALRQRTCAQGARCDAEATEETLRRFDKLEAAHRARFGGGGRVEFGAVASSGVSAWLGSRANDANTARRGGGTAATPLATATAYGHERRFRGGDTAFIFVQFDKPVRFWIPPDWRGANATPSAFLRLNTRAHFGAVPSHGMERLNDDERARMDEAVLVAGGVGTTKKFWKNDASSPLRSLRDNVDALRSTSRFPGVPAAAPTSTCRAAMQFRHRAKAPAEDAFAGAAAYARASNRFEAVSASMPRIDRGGALRPSPWSRSWSRYRTLEESANLAGDATASFYGMPMTSQPPVDHACILEGDEERREQGMDHVLAFAYDVKATDVARPLRPFDAHALRLWPPGTQIVEARDGDVQPYGLMDRCQRASTARGAGASLMCGRDDDSGIHNLDPFATEDDRREQRRRWGMGGGTAGVAGGVAAARLRLPGFRDAKSGKDAPPPPPRGPGEAAGLRRDMLMTSLLESLGDPVSSSLAMNEAPRTRHVLGTLDTSSALNTPAASAGGAFVKHVSIEARAGAPETSFAAGRASDTSSTSDVRGLADGRAATVDVVVTFSEPVAAACGYIPSTFYALGDACPATYEESSRAATLPLSLESEREASEARGYGPSAGDARTAATHPVNDRGCPFAAVELVTREWSALTFYGLNEPPHEILSRGVGDASERVLANDEYRRLADEEASVPTDRLPMTFGASEPRAHSLSPPPRPRAPPEPLLDAVPFQVVPAGGAGRRLGYATLVNRLPGDPPTTLRFRYRVRRGDNTTAVGWSSVGSLLFAQGGEPPSEDALDDALDDAVDNFDPTDAEELTWSAQVLRGAVSNLRPRRSYAMAAAAWKRYGPRPALGDCDDGMGDCLGPPYAHAAVDGAMHGDEELVYSGGAARWWRRRQGGDVDEDASHAAHTLKGAFLWAPGPTPQALRAYLVRARARDAEDEANAYRRMRVEHERDYGDQPMTAAPPVHPPGHPPLGGAMVYRLFDGATVADLTLPPPGFADVQGTSVERVALRADF